MANENAKKFLDQAGVSTLWGKIVEKVNAEADRAKGVESGLNTRLAAVEADYLKAADKTELAGKITAEETRATGVESGLNTRLGVVEADYLKAADKTALQNAINAKADQTALDAVSAVANAAVKQSVYDVKVKALEDEDARIAGLVATEQSRAEGIEGGLRTDVDNIKKDYLKAADKTELSGAISGVEARIKAVEDDYLVEADKTELEGKIALKADATALAQEVTDRTNAVAGLQTQIDTIMNNPDAEGAINSINEFTQYIKDHGEIADGFRTDINKNKDDIAAMDTAYKAADTAIKGRLDVLEAIDHEAYKAADTALKSELNAEIAKKADKTTVEGIDGRLVTAEGKVTTLEGKVSTLETNSATKSEVQAVSKSLSDYQTAHAGDYTNEQIDAAIKVNADAIAKLNDTYATDAEVEAAITAEVTRANGAYAAKALETTVANHVADTVSHVTVDDKAKWNAALQASDIATGSVNGSISVKGTDVAVKGLGSAAYKAESAFDVAGAAATAEANAIAHSDANFALIQALGEAEILAAIAAAEPQA